jgi:uncharacterized protein
MAHLDEDLLAATGAGDLAAVTAALEKGANVDARDAGFERTALMTASMHRAIPIMQALLDAGASVDLQAALGETALILAASGLGEEPIKVLLAHGADPNIADRKKKTTLMWAVDTQFHRQVDNSGCIAPLIGAGARINDRDEDGRTALHWAVTGVGTDFDVRPTVLAALVKHGADVDATDFNGETAMFALVRYVDDALALDAGPPCIQILIDAGANRNAVNDNGKTPLDLVDQNRLVRKLLRDLGFTKHSE